MPTTEFHKYYNEQSLRIGVTVALFENFLLMRETILDSLPDNLAKQKLTQTWKSFESISPSKEHFQMMAEILISKEVDTFDTYLLQLLLRIFSKDPEAFQEFFKREGSTERKLDITLVLAHIIQSDTKEEIIARLAQEQIDVLGMKGLKTLVGEVNKRLKIAFDERMPEYLSSCYLVEIRNIITHTGCRVSKTFQTNTGRKDLPVGEKLLLDFNYVSEELHKFQVFARALDKKFITTFNFLEDI